MFDTYLDLLDSQKKYFLASDYKEFKKYKFKLDNQLIDYDLSFFNLSYLRIIQMRPRMLKLRKIPPR